MKNYLTLFALTVYFLVNSVNAATLFTDSTNITVNGQSNSTDFATDGFEDFTGITLDVHAVGDYNGSNEFINFAIDSVDFGSFDTSSPSVTATNVGLAAFDWELLFSISISDSQWASFLSDSMLNISWSNGLLHVQLSMFNTLSVMKLMDPQLFQPFLSQPLFG